MKLWLIAAALLLVASPCLAKAGAATVGLADAARQGDRAAVLKQIARKADVNQPSDDGSTALLWAVHNDDAALVQALIAAKADVKAANAYGDTPMREAASRLAVWATIIRLVCPSADGLSASAPASSSAARTWTSPLTAASRMGVSP